MRQEQGSKTAHFVCSSIRPVKSVTSDAILRAGPAAMRFARSSRPDAATDVGRPPGVFFVVTMRDPEDVELYVDEPRHLPLLEADAENQADIRE